MTGVVPGLAAGVAALLLIGGSTRARGPGGFPLTPAVVGLSLCAIGAGAIVALGDGHLVVLGLVALAVVTAVSREIARRRRATAADRRADQVLAVCDGLASDLRAGQPPSAALAAAVDDWPELAPVAAAAELGADVPAALRALAERPGARQVRVVAAAWQVAHRSGSGLAASLGMAADHLRADRATARVVTTELAAAQATARMLAVLPVGVLLLGGGLGGDPFGFLLGTTPGLVCLCLGLALEYAGLAWLALIGDRVLGRR